MRLKCPDCGSTISVERLQDERDFREIVEIYKSLSPVEASLTCEYVECFRASTHAEMPARKYARILKEVERLLKEGRFSYGKYTYQVDREIALEAMQKTVDTEKRAFRNHNYWKAIMIGLLKKRGALEEKETEDQRQQTAEKREKSEPVRAPIPDWVRKKIYDE